uniref:RRM domain-containing protein n=1 Tax=Erythrolobus australicus TaxID=1077150 RepID=A0A7S1XK09_9RHOD|mmetsp:Transcript_991/g.2826  ORF Transcript_991/g.2826 Transcript_991/m.2826 type:complete len:242 (+) Transcript_991:153-878(+)|eukprot:CAMPEP_0185834254 /NCGR_PEP_ID=MMETSP1353-20130828/4888_1 /TAXON_ID=1077150 /ORGANISM="Erythrolobus australicus, Strain CCMP3124" /LENGTH=241 /DNA_ID=CAMNT_0028532659 /DNA_START=63 /DNA_END=788 /DNA_ORIENTATION=-
MDSSARLDDVVLEKFETGCRVTSAGRAARATIRVGISAEDDGALEQTLEEVIVRNKRALKAGISGSFLGRSRAISRGSNFGSQRWKSDPLDVRHRMSREEYEARAGSRHVFGGGVGTVIKKRTHGKEALKNLTQRTDGDKVTKFVRSAEDQDLAKLKSVWVVFRGLPKAGVNARRFERGLKGHKFVCVKELVDAASPNCWRAAVQFDCKRDADHILSKCERRELFGGAFLDVSYLGKHEPL